MMKILQMISILICSCYMLIGTEILAVKNKLLTQSNAQSQFETPKIYIFVSSSMPQNLINDYAIQARKYDAQLVIKGFIDNSYKKTVAWLHNVVPDKKGSIIVAPSLFSEYSVHTVPSIVLVGKNGFDKLSGAAGIRYTLEQIADEGELKEVADNLMGQVE